MELISIRTQLLILLHDTEIRKKKPSSGDRVVINTFNMEGLILALSLYHEYLCNKNKQVSEMLLYVLVSYDEAER